MTYELKMSQMHSEMGRMTLFFLLLHHHKVPVTVRTSSLPLLRPTLCVLSPDSSASRFPLGDISRPTLTVLIAHSAQFQLHAGLRELSGQFIIGELSRDMV